MTPDPVTSVLQSVVSTDRKSAQVLVLDDDPSIAELLGESVNALGHRATICSSPTDALSLIEARDFDVVLSDVRMPELSGQQFYDWAIRIKPYLTRRFIFLTGDVAGDDTTLFLKSTGSLHLAKPFQLTRLETTLRLVLAERAPQPGPNRSPNP